MYLYDYLCLSVGLMEMTPGFSSICEEGYVGGSKQSNTNNNNANNTNHSVIGGIANNSHSQSLSGVPSSEHMEFVKADEEQDNLGNGLPISKSIFVDNQSIIAGFKHGLRSQTYSARTKDGVLFEYSLENINETPIIESSGDFRGVSRPIETAAMGVGAGTSTGTGTTTTPSGARKHTNTNTGADMSKWKQDPPCKGYDYTSTVFGEIVSGSGFDGDKVFVSYEMLVPTGTGETQWQLRKGNLVDGIVAADAIKSYYQDDKQHTMNSTTNLFGPNTNTNTANEASNTNSNTNSNSVKNPLVMQSMLDDKDSEGGLSGSTLIGHNKQVYGRYALGCGSSEVGRNGNGQNPTEMFKYSDKYPEHFQLLGQNMSETSRMILGISFFCLSCLSVTLGLSSPCWIIPCIVIFYVLGMGMPGGGDILVMNNMRKQMNDNETIKRVITHTNKSDVYTIPASTCLTDPMVHFNHLINISFDVKTNKSSFTENPVHKCDMETLKHIKTAMGCTADSIIVVFEVYSIGWFGRYVTEGSTDVRRGGEVTVLSVLVVWGCIMTVVVLAGYP